MREIKFRGKRHNGEWVYGSLVYFSNSVVAIHYEIGTTAVKCFDWCYVDPDTVGQFTGLRDKNGEDIYEGDIIAVCSVEHKEKMIVHEIFYDEREGRFKAGLNGTHNRGDFGCCGLDDAGWVQSKEVIGNIHDNFDLMK